MSNSAHLARSRLRGSAAAALFTCLLTIGCAVGPNFKPPAPPTLNSYAAAPGPTRLDADDASQTLEPGQPIQANWWRLFGSASLDDLVDAGLKASPTLASARAALKESQEQAKAGAGIFYPSLSGSATGASMRVSPAENGGRDTGSTYRLYTLAGEVNYMLDLLGGQRRMVEALNAQADYQHHAVGAAYLTLTGEIADTAIARAGYAADVAALEEIVETEADQRDILRTEYQAGHGDLATELTAEQQLDADRQSLAVAQQRLAAADVLLHVLVGREPAESSPKPPALEALTVPAVAPVSLPSQLVRQRPDILEAEAQLHAASAQVGVATAALFPSISITGDYGHASTAMSALGGPAGRFWSVGPAVDIPLFHGGALWFGRKAAQAAYRKAAADYRQTVLAALEQVSDSLRALDTDAVVTDASRTAVDAAELNRRLSDDNRQAGTLSDYDSMSAIVQDDRARLALIAAKTQRLQDVVALYLACGGDWDGHESEADQ